MKKLRQQQQQSLRRSPQCLLSFQGNFKIKDILLGLTITMDKNQSQLYHFYFSRAKEEGFLCTLVNETFRTDFVHYAKDAALDLCRLS